MELVKGVIERPQKIIIYGPEGIGKSTFAAQFPDPIFIDTEGSTMRLDVMRTPKPSSWAMLMEQVQYIKNNPQICKTLVIDTADWAEKLCVQAICARAKKDGIEDFGYGKGYTYATEEFGKLLNLLEDLIGLGLHVVFTAHAQLRKFEQPDEMGSYDRWEMKLLKQTPPMLREWADMVLFANYETFVVKTEGMDKNKGKAQGGRRVMYTSHHPCWDAKNRHGLADKVNFDYSVIAPHIKEFRSSALDAADMPPAKAEPKLEPSPPAIESPKPISEPESQQGKEKTVENWAGIPKALADLMRSSGVSPGHIQRVVAKKGYYPEDTPISRYDPDFINGVLISAWKDVLGGIQDMVAKDMKLED